MLAGTANAGTGERCPVPASTARSSVGKLFWEGIKQWAYCNFGCSGAVLISHNLIAAELSLRLVHHFEAAGIAPQVQTLVQIAHLHVPRAYQLHRQVPLGLYDLDRVFAVDQGRQASRIIHMERHPGRIRHFRHHR